MAVVNAPVRVIVRASSIRAISKSDGSGSVMLSGLVPGAYQGARSSYAGDAGHGATSGSVALSVIGRTSIAASVDRTTATPDKSDHRQLPGHLGIHRDSWPCRQSATPESVARSTWTPLGVDH